MSVTHLAGTKVEANGRLRQRCAWCGALLFDYELANVAVAGDEWREPGTAEPDTWWRVDDHAVARYGWRVEPEPHPDNPERIKIPDDSCMRLDPDATL